MTRPERFVLPHVSGSIAPQRGGDAPRWCAMLLALHAAVACAPDEEQRTLEPSRVAMNESVAAIYDDGELVIYEVKAPFQLPIIAPGDSTREDLASQGTEPYGAEPWVHNDQVEVQISWLISNLDPETHNVELVIDPWNEFGRYWPGVTVIDEEEGEALPNLSGYDRLMEIPGTNEPGEARVHGVITFANMRELAIDFATVINIIQNPPPEEDGSYAAATLVNHAFDIHNSSENDPLVRGYIPDVIAGLTGFDFGLRTFEPVNVALEIVVEIVDTGDERVLEEGSRETPLAMPEMQYTIGQ
jgi:hypothetical protein